MSWLIDITSHEVQLNSLLTNIMDGYPFHILSNLWFLRKFYHKKCLDGGLLIKTLPIGLPSGNKSPMRAFKICKTQKNLNIICGSDKFTLKI